MTVNDPSVSGQHPLTVCPDEIGRSNLSPGRLGAEAKPRLLLLGLGNDLLGDDAVGLRVAAEARPALAHLPSVTVLETTEMGLALLDFVVGYNEVVLVDAIQTGIAPPGFVHAFDGLDLVSLPVVSPHFLGVGEVLSLGRRLGMPVPTKVRIFAIEVADPFTLRTELSPALQLELASIVARVVAEVTKSADALPHPGQDLDRSPPVAMAD